MQKPMFGWKMWTGAGTLAVVGFTAIVVYVNTSRPVQTARAAELDLKPIDIPSVPVQFVHPQKGLLERRSTQPGSVQAYQSVRLFSKAPGFLKELNVDIGDRIKRGQVLAKVDVPELEAQVVRARACVDQAKAKVRQMKARETSAQADLDAAKAAVIQAEATAKSASAWVRYRVLQHKRLKDLFETRSIEERLVDESKERKEAAIEAELSAEAAITTSKAKVTACAAKIEAAQADVVEAESQVRVAEAELTRAEVQVGFATIKAPFDGVVVHRSLFPGDFVRSAEGSNQEPLLTVHRTDLMRMVVQIPDRDVLLADRGDAAVVEIHALGGKRMDAKISRIARSEDPQTRLMQVEIDLPNPTGEICHGMYGHVSIVLDTAAEQLSIPSGCLVGRAQAGVGTVYVIRDKHAQLVKVRLGTDNGLRVAVLSGLSPADEVILQPSNLLTDGAPVHASEMLEAAASRSNP